MYDNPVCKTGGLCLVIGGLAISGWWLAALLVALVALVAVGVRVAFRRGKDSSDA